MKKIHPPAPQLVIVGMEGIWGVFSMIIFLIILQYTPGYEHSCIDNFEKQCYMGNR